MSNDARGEWTVVGGKGRPRKGAKLNIASSPNYTSRLTSQGGSVASTHAAQPASEGGDKEVVLHAAPHAAPLPGWIVVNPSAIVEGHGNGSLR